MPKYFIHVAFEEGAPQRIHGPFDSVREAHDFGEPFAQEGLDVECRTDEAICDFCSDPKVEWGYPAHGFEIEGEHIMGGGWASRGGWAACAVCYDLIESNDQAGLVKHSTDAFFKKNREIPDIRFNRRVVTRHIAQVHAMFFVAKFGQDAQKGKNDPPFR